MTNKFYKLLIIIALIIFGGGDFLEAQTTVASGKCGDNLYYRISDDGVLTIFGTGPMWSYDKNDNKSPWNNSGTTLKTLVLEEGMTSVGNYAFYNCDGFTGSLTIPNSVTSVGNYAFNFCLGFTGSLTIPNSVTSIGDYAFYECKGFTGDLTIGNSVTSIGEKAFYRCFGFTGSLTIPNSVTSIGDYAFYECKGFTGSLTIPNSVETIGNYAFAYLDVTGSLTIPNSVISIGSSAFYLCEGFTGSLTIPNSVTSIGNYAFAYCSGLTGSLTIGNNVTSIGERAFYNCSGFTGNLTIPNSVTSIGNYAFYNCSGFTGSLTIGNSVTSIGYGAFCNCTGFTGSLTIGNSVTSIGYRAFENCNNFTDVYSFSETAPSLDFSYGDVFTCTNATLHYLASAEQSYDENGWFDYFNKRQAYDFDSDGFIIIDSKEKLVAFANIVNLGNKNLNARLHSDIDLENMEWSPICSTGLYYVTTPYPDAGYLGTFDGNGHVISNLKITGTAEDASFGLFGTLSGTVRNLGIENFTFTGAGGDTRVGAVVGQMIDGSLVENCYAANGNINTQVNTTNGVAGGIAGCNYAATVKNSFSYNFTITAGRYGGIVGDNRADGGETDRPGVLENCYTDYGTFHHAQNSGVSATGNANVTEAQFTSGEIAYLLQGEQENLVWGQNIDNEETAEAYPALNGDKVYAVSCGGYIYKYSNSETEDIPEHDFENGFCSVCGSYEPATDTDGDGFVEIDNGGKMFWFAQQVNALLVNDLKAELTDSIDLESREWTPIGRNTGSEIHYIGHFNGNGYNIDNFKMTVTSAGDHGLFRIVTNYAIVENFSISGEVTIDCAETTNYGIVCRPYNSTVSNVHSSVNLKVVTGNGGNRIGGIVGHATGNEGQTNTLTVDRCSFSGKLEMQNNDVDCLGGIIGYVEANQTANITNCGFYGEISSECNWTDQIGGIMGYYRGSNLTLKNCLSVGGITTNDNTANGAVMGILRQHSSANTMVTNNYCLSGNPFGNSDSDDDIVEGYNGQTAEGSATAATGTQLASGEIAYKLQGEQETHVWGQNIDNEETPDAYPVLNGAKVYKHPFGVDVEIYSNQETYDGMIPNGRCGDNLYWNITDNTLTIFGTGPMWNYNNGDNKSPWRQLDTAPTTLVLEEGMTSVGNHAFRNCDGFTGSLTIPNSVTSIGEYAFGSSNGFNGSLTIGNSVETIGNNAFRACNGFTGSLTIGNSVTSIGNSAFDECSGFTGSLTIPNSVTSIGNFAFYDCYGFTGDLTIPNSVETIGQDAFYNCSGFTGDLTIGNSVTSIGSYAFYKCSGFTGDLTIPNSVETIELNAFDNCSGFSDVFFYREECPEIGGNTFLHFNANAKIHVPVIWESFTNIPEDKLVKMPTFISQQTTDNGQQTSSTDGWVGLAEGQTEPGAEEHVAINAALVLGQQTTDNGQQTSSTEENQQLTANSQSLSVKSFGYCGMGTTVNGSITIEDGGQLYCEIARGEVTVKKEIEGYAGQQSTDNGQQTSSTEEDQSSTKWYTIASPLKDAVDLESPLCPQGLINPSDNYDLYRYDEPTFTWQNAKPGEGSTNFQTLDPGRGYLYANAENTTLEFKGDINTETVTYKLTAKGEKLTGFHLIGNPFTHDIKFSHLTASENATLANGYYILNGDGAWGATLGSNAEDVIKPGQGALIKTTADGELAIANELSAVSRQRSVSESESVLALSVTNGKHSDRAFVVFDKGAGLDKINHENENIPLLYIPMEDADYAIAMMDENVNEIPVNFETNVMGQYTISLRQENCNLEGMYLLDKETGNKVNILEEDYTFMAMSGDNAERFVLAKDNGQQTTDNGHFAYVNNGDIVIFDIEGDAKIRIVDALGRCVYNGEAADETNRISASGFANGVYIIEKTDDKGINVQKMIL